MPDNQSSEYEVGYGRPPQRTRFKSGESGNPRRRPRGSKNLALLLEKRNSSSASLLTKMAGDERLPSRQR
jgi:hypothetical protein